MNTDLHFSSASAEWSTPQDFFEEYNRIYRFTLDVCATPANKKASKYYTIASHACYEMLWDGECLGLDGLAHDWGTERCWMNPPYGREIIQWMRKAYEASQNGALVVCLVPSRTDTAWWHDYAMQGDVTFIRGRLKFGGHANSAPFPSAVVVFFPRKPAATIPIA